MEGSPPTDDETDNDPIGRESPTNSGGSHATYKRSGGQRVVMKLTRN